MYHCCACFLVFIKCIWHLDVIRKELEKLKWSFQWFYMSHGAGMCITPTTLCQCSLLQPGFFPPSSYVTYQGPEGGFEFLPLSAWWYHSTVRLQNSTLDGHITSQYICRKGYFSLYYVVSESVQSEQSGCHSCPPGSRSRARSALTVKTYSCEWVSQSLTNSARWRRGGISSTHLNSWLDG